MTPVFGNINYRLFLAIRKRFSDYCRQTGVGWLKSEIDEFAVFTDAISSFGNNVDIVVHYDKNPF